MVEKPQHTSVRARNEAYTSRLLAAMALVVGLAGILANLPIRPSDGSRVGWQVLRPDEVIALENVRFEEGLSQLPGSIISDQPPIPSADIPAETPVKGDDGETEEESGAQVEEAGPDRVLPVERLVLAAAETMPEIQGGLGAYYINIVYPQEAVDAGVEGRLVLDFVVEADGRATEVTVYQSLHPACDSSAVQALRKTLFMPGRSKGQAVAVRMRLPVLFQILDVGSNDPDSPSAAS
jgi:periplasmic protein TonB